jgi:hypothetical protein
VATSILALEFFGISMRALKILDPLDVLEIGSSPIPSGSVV